MHHCDGIATSIDWMAAPVAAAHFIPPPAHNRSIAVAVHQHGAEEAPRGLDSVSDVSIMCAMIDSALSAR